jgi:hypothetical protein
MRRPPANNKEFSTCAIAATECFCARTNHNNKNLIRISREREEERRSFQCLFFPLHFLALELCKKFPKEGKKRKREENFRDVRIFWLCKIEEVKRPCRSLARGAASSSRKYWIFVEFYFCLGKTFHARVGLQRNFFDICSRRFSRIKISFRYKTVLLSWQKLMVSYFRVRSV